MCSLRGIYLSDTKSNQEEADAPESCLFSVSYQYFLSSIPYLGNLSGTRIVVLWKKYIVLEKEIMTFWYWKYQYALLFCPFPTGRTGSPLWSATMALPNISLFLVETGQWKRIADLDGFCIKRNNHGNNWKIICWEAELATLPCHFEMCAEVFSSICRGNLIKSVLFSFSFVLGQLTISISTVSAGWISFLLPLCIWKPIWHHRNICTGHENNSEKICQTDQRGEISS